MGFLDFFFKSEEEYPDGLLAYNSEDKPASIKYSDKGVSKSASKKNPYRATLTINTKNKKSEPIYHNVHIGVFETKEEAQKARWEYIESLK